MGRRRYRKRVEEESGLEVLLSAAFQSTSVGAILTVILVIVAGVCFGNPQALHGMLRLLGWIALPLAAVVALMTVIGFAWRESAKHGSAVGGLLRQLSDRPQPSGRAPLPPLAAPGAAPAVNPTPPPPASLLSKGEMAFYHPLREIVAGRYTIQVKPSLADVLQCRNAPRGKQIATMHVDFVLCDLHTLQPRLAIELDDRSHRRQSRAQVDRWKNELLAERGVRLLRWPCERAYDFQLLRNEIERAIR